MNLILYWLNTTTKFEIWSTWLSREGESSFNRGQNINGSDKNAKLLDQDMRMGCCHAARNRI
jgi:hypothetical protein